MNESGERELARRKREAADWEEVHRRHIDQLEMETLGMEFEIEGRKDDLRHTQAERRELLIDCGVAAARRGEDPIRAMDDMRLRAAFFSQAVKEGYFTKEGRTTAKGQRLMAHVRAALA